MMVPSPPLHHDMWVIPLLVMAAVNLITILTYWVCRTCHPPRPPFLSQCLLLGLLLGSALGFAFAVEQSDFICVAIRMGTGISYVVIYASLMVKQVFLISLNTSVYLPVMYQILLFSFCVLVQIAISVQWLIVGLPSQFNSKDHILSLLYIFFLVIFVTLLSIKSLHIKANAQESPTICLLMIITISVWIIWPVAANLLPKTYHKAAFGKIVKFLLK